MYTPLFPDNIEKYCEPFVGGGAVFFHLRPETAYINDINSELINVYEIIRDDVDGLINELKRYKNDSETYYSIRALDRNSEQYMKMSEKEKAARILYLNRTCYNGLYRVNKAGQYNSPYGYYTDIKIVNEPVLRAVSEYFNFANIHFYSEDYSEILKIIPDNTFVYLDPPYDTISDTANFTMYSKTGFCKSDQLELRNWCDNLTERGIKFMLSNSATDFMIDLYKKYNISIVQAKRSVNSNGAKRGGANEIVVRNYGRNYEN